MVLVSLNQITYPGTEKRSYGHLYLVLLNGIAMQGSGADPAGVQLIAHVVGEVHIGRFQEGSTVL